MVRMRYFLSDALPQIQHFAKILSIVPEEISYHRRAFYGELT